MMYNHPDIGPVLVYREGEDVLAHALVYDLVGAGESIWAALDDAVAAIATMRDSEFESGKSEANAVSFAPATKWLRYMRAKRYSHYSERGTYDVRFEGSLADLLPQLPREPVNAVGA